MKKLIALSSLVLFSFCSQVFAADAFTFHNLGFSADGRYFAFVESVMGDGSGMPIARGHVVDVARNTWVESARVFIEDETSMEEDAVRQVVAKLRLSHYGISKKNSGQTLWVRLPTDISARAKRADFSTDYGVDGGASSLNPKFRLQLAEVAPTNTIECYDYAPKMIEVNLIRADYGANDQIVLQRDTKLPASRGCAHSYGLREVIGYKGSIVAVVRYLTLGFEGPDFNHMVITGQGALK